MTTDDPMDDLPVLQALPVAPPTQPGELGLSARRTVWPMVLGIIAVVFGSLGTLGGLWGAIAPFVMGAFADLFAKMPSAPGQHPAKVFEAMSEYRYWMMAASLVSTAVAAWLLVAGIVLLKRGASARRLCMVWAVLKMPTVVAAGIVGMLPQMESFDTMIAAQTGPAPQGVRIGMMIGLVFGGLFALIWGWALPVFFLVWFSRGKIKAETAGWADGRDHLDSGLPSGRIDRNEM